MNLQFLRDYIRVQLDMDEEELPNGLLDSYISEGYMRTLSMERRWPFFEGFFDAAKVPDAETVTIPVDCDPVQIISVIDTGRGVRLLQVSNEQAEDHFTDASAHSAAPTYYSIWGGELRLWPEPMVDGEINLRIRGYRRPTDWVMQGASAEVDADPRLHILFAHYAIALCYAQQEDEVLEDVYMKRWQASWAAAHNAICAPRHHRPLVLNAGLVVGGGTTDLVWNLPN